MTTTNKILWGIAAVLCVIAALSFPKTAQLHREQAELKSVNKQISRYNHLMVNQNSTNNSTKIIKKEKIAQDKLSESLSLALGGIHSANDWKNNQAKLKNVLGGNLTNQLKIANQNPNTREWDLLKNNRTVISFGNANGNIVPVTAAICVENKDHVIGNYLINMGYDLHKQKIYTYTVHVLTARGSDNILRGGHEDE